MKRPQFSLKTLLFVLTLWAVLFAWLVDHRRQAARIKELEGPHEFFFIDASGGGLRIAE